MIPRTVTTQVGPRARHGMGGCGPRLVYAEGEVSGGGGRPPQGCPLATPRRAVVEHTHTATAPHTHCARGCEMCAWAVRCAVCVCVCVSETDSGMRAGLSWARECGRARVVCVHGCC